MSTNITDPFRRKINLIAEKYDDAVDRLLKLQIARGREETRAAKFALFASAAASDAERARFSAYAKETRAAAAETFAELAAAARELIDIAGTMEAYGLPADPEILCMAYHIDRANH